MSAEFVKRMLKCNATEECLDGVRSGEYVYAQVCKAKVHIAPHIQTVFSGRCGDQQYSGSRTQEVGKVHVYEG